MNNIEYISLEETFNIYRKTIEKSGGGFSGIRDEGGMKSVLEFIQNDLYYPDFVSKLSYLVFRFCSGHFFNDGNILRARIRAYVYNNYIEYKDKQKIASTLNMRLLN